MLSSETWSNALNIVITKPHSVDKRLAGQETLLSFKQNIPSDQELKKLQQVLTDILSDAGNLQDENLSSKLSEKICNSDINTEKAQYHIQKLVSRKGGDLSYQLVIRYDDTVTFVPIKSKDSGVFSLTLINRLDSTEPPSDCDVVEHSDQHQVIVKTSQECGRSQCVWIKNRLVPRLLSWAENVSSSVGTESLRLVGVHDYSLEYQRLKERYAGDIITNWGESSDPEKFVHEDLGIAAYILLLWRRQAREESWPAGRKQTFVDLGCGNGLLVYILTMEGHTGVGYDLRRRNIWSWYPDIVQLEERTIVPSLTTSYQDTDWILGNHSDELTPWIPVLASLSGVNTSFWVLPCCPFSFTGKYQRRSSESSVWRDYLDWIVLLCGEMGFSVEEDRMKIPSTKRVCLVGKRKETVSMEVVKSLTANNDDSVEKFVPRQKIEKVRNCTKLEKIFTQTIVDKVVSLCLSEQNSIIISGKHWNAGKTISLATIANKLMEENFKLEKLKQECGGLQTLFRNHHYIFVVEKGSVRLKVPGRDVKKSSKNNNKSENMIKTKPCWQHNNHPDGCPLSELDCSWIH